MNNIRRMSTIWRETGLSPATGFGQQPVWVVSRHQSAGPPETRPPHRQEASRAALMSDQGGWGGAETGGLSESGGLPSEELPLPRLLLCLLLLLLRRRRAPEEWRDDSNRFGSATAVQQMLLSKATWMNSETGHQAAQSRAHTGRPAQLTRV